MSKLACLQVLRNAGQVLELLVHPRARPVPESVKFTPLISDAGAQAQLLKAFSSAVSPVGEDVVAALRVSRGRARVGPCSSRLVRATRAVLPPLPLRTTSSPASPV